MTYHCPPRFSETTIEQIQHNAAELFKLFGMKDFARFDGWVMPDGNLWFSDFNPISGMEQNSFLFMQAARIGMTHRDVLKHIVHTSLARHDIKFSPPKPAAAKKQRVNVIFGGATAERQVSVMSGTNVWLKLRQSQTFEPYPFLLDMEGEVWELPYSLTLNHTVEEIHENCLLAVKMKSGTPDLEQRC